jgi:hypothetical protein
MTYGIKNMTLGWGKIYIPSFVVTDQMLEENRLKVLLHEHLRQNPFCSP